MGTRETRIDQYYGPFGCNRNPQPERFGGWPYEAVWVDINWGDNIIHSDGGGPLAFGEAMMAPLFYISVPLDLAIDTVLLPVDLVAWPCGYEKKKYLYRWDLDSEGRWKK